MKKFHYESRESLTRLESVGFSPSNAHDEFLKSPCYGTEELSKLLDLSEGLAAELNAKIGDTFIRVFWNEGTGCIFDARMCSANQLSYSDHDQ